MAIEDPNLFRASRIHRPALIAVSVVALLLSSVPSHALILKTWNGVGTPALANTTAPADDPGWANLASNKTGIYLGDGLFLTAHHAAAAGNVVLGGQTYPLIPGSAHLLNNPATFGARTVASGVITEQSDLMLFRIGLNAQTGLLPEEANSSIRVIKIADELPPTSANLTMFGFGANRILNPDNSTNGQWYFAGDGTTVPTQGQSSYRGFKYTPQPSESTRQWQWGQNVRTTNSGGAYQSGNNIHIDLGAPYKDAIGFQMRFDEFGLPDEAQGAAGDSGGPVFWKDGNEWVLAGLMHGIYIPNNDLDLLGAFTSYTAISDLSYSTYASQLASASSTYSVMGDINLDGVVTGGIVNGVATGDLAVLVNNWLYSSEEANIHTWTKGDLNLDGKVNLADFVQMRGALGGTISSTAFARLLGATTIPEPSTLVLAVAALAPLRRRRR